jgi:hypothetical protein
VIPGLGKALQRLIDRVRREDDRRTEDHALHRDSFPRASTGHMARVPDDAHRSGQLAVQHIQQKAPSPSAQGEGVGGQGAFAG